jgi:hypothetical protein
MSKLKTPRQKKGASYAHDRRNVYGENDKATRKSLPRKKARLNRAFRHEVHGELRVDGAPVEKLDLDVIDASVTAARRKKFKKQPDVPLLDYIEGQRKKRARPPLRAPAAKKRKSAR